MKLDVRTVGAFQENCYLVADEASGRGVLVDPGAEPRRLIEMVEAAGIELEAIWLTHAHVDHIGGIAGVVERWPVPVHLHPADLPIYERGEMVAAMYGVPFEQPATPDRGLAEGDVLSVGTLSFEVIHAPGHAPGHVALIGEGIMLGGDLLFAGSIGRTDLPLSDPGAMERSLARLLDLDPALVVYPGHGPATTLGEELETNPFLTAIARQQR